MCWRLSLDPPSVVIWDEQNRQQVLIEPITNYYIHNVRKFETVIGTSDRSRTIPIIGSFFSQQNNLTSGCAHAALRMAINSSLLFQNSKITNKQINDILDIDFSSPDKTELSAAQIQTVVEAIGGEVISADFQRDTSIEYDNHIYPIVESGYPVILGVEGWDAQNAERFGHALAVLGHTMNSDRWGPEARHGYRYFPVMDYLIASGFLNSLFHMFIQLISINLEMCSSITVR